MNSQTASGRIVWSPYWGWGVIVIRQARVGWEAT
jgi:hypothetical protein